MQSRPIYAISGAIIGAVVDVLINLLAAGIQQHAFAQQFSIQSIWGLAGLAIVGLLLGYWLGKPLQIPATPSPPSGVEEKSDTVSVTRLQAFWSHNKLKGRGIHLRSLFLFGSKNEIDTD